MSWKAIPLCLLGVVGIPQPGAAQALSQCTVGQRVTDKADRTGEIVTDSDGFCQMRYDNGQIFGWDYWDLRPAASNIGTDSAASSAELPNQTSHSPTATDLPGQQGATIIRPTDARSLVYHADAQGHFLITGIIHRTPIRFLVDTGATLVFLTPEDARNAGINDQSLAFDLKIQTANGPARGALVILDEISIESITVRNVRAAVVEKLDQSILGMSVLDKLKGFEIRAGTLTVFR